jgi:hypothetical protein
MADSRQWTDTDRRLVADVLWLRANHSPGVPPDLAELGPPPQHYWADAAAFLTALEPLFRRAATNGAVWALLHAAADLDRNKRLGPAPRLTAYDLRRMAGQLQRGDRLVPVDVEQGGA